MQKTRCAGRHLMVWGALFLLAWAGYELVVRAQTIWWAVKGVYNLCVNEQIPFLRAMGYFDATMFELMGFLALCVLFALLTICLRNRPHAAWILCVFAAGIGWYGMNGFALPSGDPVAWFQKMDIFAQLQLIKLIPVLLIVIGCIANLCQWANRRGNRRASRRPAASAHDRRESGRYEDDEDDFDEYDDPSARRRREEAIRRRRRNKQVI